MPQMPQVVLRPPPATTPCAGAPLRGDARLGLVAAGTIGAFCPDGFRRAFGVPQGCGIGFRDSSEGCLAAICPWVAPCGDG